MRKIAGLIVLLAVVLLGARASFSKSSGKDSVEQELVMLEQKWNDLSQKKDAAALEPMLADGYQYISTEGEVGDKALLLKHMKEGEPDEPKYQKYALDEVNPRVFGNAAVVSGRWTGTGTEADPYASTSERWTDFWVKQNGTWKCVASHSTTVAKK